MVLAFVVIASASCSAAIRWEKPGVGAGERQRDETECTSLASREEHRSDARASGRRPVPSCPPRTPGSSPTTPVASRSACGPAVTSGSRPARRPSLRSTRSSGPARAAGRVSCRPRSRGARGRRPHVLDDGLDLRVAQDEAEGRHPRLAEGRPAVANQLGEILVRQRRHGRAGEVAGPQEEQTRPPRVSTPRGAVAARAVRLEERAAGLRPAGRRRQRRANQGHAGGQEGQQRDPADSPGDGATARQADASRPRSSGVRCTSGVSSSSGPVPVTRIRPASST